MHAGAGLPGKPAGRSCFKGRADTHRLSGHFVTDEVLTRVISELRRALSDDAKRPRLIETIPKIGYRIIAPVEPVIS
jgi:DNA-binding winged helix-turn-helix (wHTH) protein